ncbi:MAG: hypothetical protein IJL86_01865, partial [Bacteroidales bacterium]|nr:hypothetical protein [Bacteroidales bacterium]
MRFEDVLHNGKLWAVVYDGDSQNILTKTFANWLNPAFLEDFFIRNSKDLESYFNITNLDVAVYDTITDAVSLSCMILDIRPDANLDMLFRPLENQRVREMLLSREKAKGKEKARPAVMENTQQSRTVETKEEIREEKPAKEHTPRE